jgi:hypothetical protein
VTAVIKSRKAEHLSACHKGEEPMLYTIISLLVLFWVVGLLSHVGGSFIHALLVIALAIFVFDLVTGRRAAL